jgi:uncharacterized protein YggU (UPF0235/DUF167 family)
MMRISGLTFSVQIKPGHVANQILMAERDEDGLLRLEVGVVPLPINGPANSALISLFSKELRLPRSSIKILSGETARFKRLHIKGDPQNLATQIIAAKRA